MKALRPKQWIKSVLVLAAPAAAGMLGNGTVLFHTLVALVGFSLCASGGYLINDAADVEQDRRHPKKRHRPIAAGIVPANLARVVGVLLVLGTIAGGALLADWRLGLVLAVYVALTFSYSWWLKHMPVVELMVVAGFFLLRPIAGAAATGVPMSQWFLIVASFGSLYMVAGKRTAEVTDLGEDASAHRKSLSAYPVSYLRQIELLAAAVTLLAYCLWAFERAAPGGFPWYQISIVPITFGLMRYQLLLERGHGGAPEEAVLGDRHLLLAGLAWVVLFGLGIYVQ
ncbi:MAG: decaprenyl-phosphate phosphoribosyltransferase [Frankiaceae bacterium]|nr:decaprenyl-phosphate phosphoribosyltransferase [Frankiaceae bacterium]MDQ1635831.1 decaprenyl-phosphate phosphoribosyltransferase [Frankiaceae bacterium]MDQ1649466.1 decaprenyl-phosphate phosphoribosyltransferase [Frankiaceae bacterium]MDQ1672874.1 decaprenyl-phosphate phosphoribosyltransferase [Frankiaceae bacterium]